MKTNPNNSFPILETKRLILRQISSSDATDIYNIFSDKDVVKYYDLSKMKSIKQALKLISAWERKFQNNKGIRWGIIQKQNPQQIIGTCGFVKYNLKVHEGEIGYDLNKQYWHNGFMQEAISKILEYGFTKKKLNRIEAIVIPGNQRSVAVLNKIGFSLEGTLRAKANWKKSLLDIQLFSLLQDEYQQSIIEPQKIKISGKEKLGLDKILLESCMSSAFRIADKLDASLNNKSTTSIERSLARILGINETNKNNIPLVNILIEDLIKNGKLSDGLMYWIGNAVISTNLDPVTIARMVDSNKINLTTIPEKPFHKIKESMVYLFDNAIEKIVIKKEERFAKANANNSSEPLKYVIVGTGNIYDDIEHALVACESGADIISLIRSTAQSLLDYIPNGPSTEGHGGTFATQENFRILREALDTWSLKNKKYIRLSSFCSGLCMPEFAVIGAIEGIDNMVNDALYGILYRNINPERTFIDQKVSRKINALAKIVINTGEDNYLRTMNAEEAFPIIVCSQMINYFLAKRSGLPDNQIAMGNAFEVSPNTTNGLLYEIANAQLTRELFPNCKTKYMPPTKHMDGNIFRTLANDILFDFVSTLTNQDIHLVGMMTEGIVNPYIHDKYISTKNSSYLINFAKNISDEINFKSGGIIQTKANQIMKQAGEILEKIEDAGVLGAIETGFFGNIKRKINEGVGKDGVFEVSNKYFNPLFN